MPIAPQHVLRGIALLLAVAAACPAHAQLVISEFRLRGPNGAFDEFIEIHNNSGVAHTVAATSGTGYGLAASDGVTRCTIPNGLVIPDGGHFLCVNSFGYSLASYPAGNGTNATGDATFTTDIPDNAGIALFDNNGGGGSYTLANRIDAVGSTAEANTLYKEGAGYPALTPFSIDYAFYRDTCGKGGSITATGACTLTGAKDTDNNAADFIFVDSNGTSAGAGQRLGAAGPQNMSSPTTGSTVAVTTAPLDSCVSDQAPPNRVRDFTSDPANNSTFGTLDLRQTVTNTSGAALSRLRYRVVDLTTFPAPSGFADLRPRTSTAVVVTVDRPPCGSGTSNVTVQGTTLEQPPSQPNGGGFNSSLSSGTVTLATPLADGDSIDVRLLLGIQQTGCFKVGFQAETLPGGGFAAPVVIEGGTDGGCTPPIVISIVRAEADPTNATTVTYTVTFDQSVTSVDISDFDLTTTGSIAGASVTAISGSGATRIVTVSTGTGVGTIRLDLIDNDSIVNAQLFPLGGSGTGNGSYTTGEVYSVDTEAPSVTIEQAIGQADPTAASPILFTVTFSEPVTGFTNSDVVVSGSAGATAALVSGGPTVFAVEVSDMTANGTVIASIGAGVAADAATNPNTAATSVDNTVTFTGIDDIAPTVTIEQAIGQADPTATSPIAFTVTFSEPVTGFATGDVTLGGTAGATTAVVSGGPAVYSVAVSGMTANGTVSASIGAGVAADAAANANVGSTSVDNTVTFTGIDDIAPTVTIEQAIGQADPTATSPIAFTVTFSEPVTGFATGDVTLGGTAGATTAVVSGGPAVYSVAVSGMTANGTVSASIGAGVAADAATNANVGSTSVDNTVTFTGIDDIAPTVTIEQAIGQADPTATSPIMFTVTFSEAVSGFDGSDVVLAGSAGATTAVVTGGPTVYAVAVSGMSADGTVIASIGAGAAADGAANPSAASTSVDNSVGYDTTAPTVTIVQAAGQLDPAPSSPILFTVTFSEPVTGFTAADLTLGGTASPTTAVVSGGPAVYTVAVSGMGSNGTVTLALAAGVVTDAAGNASAAATVIDGTVMFSGGFSAPAVIPVDGLGWLLLLGAVVALAGLYVQRRNA